MPIEFDCSTCHKRLRVPDQVAGAAAKCPHCGTVQTAPDTTTSETPPSIPAAPAGATGNPYADNPYRDAPDDQGNPYASPQATTRVEPTYFGRRYRLASRGDRFLGAVLDWICLIAAVAPGFAIAGLADAAAPALEQLGGLVTFLGFVAYQGVQWYLITTSSQSLGKRMMNMRLITTNGSPPGFVHGVILRNWVLGFTCLCYPIGGLLLLVDSLLIFGENRQCLHDLIASTLVVSDKPSTTD